MSLRFNRAEGLWLGGLVLLAFGSRSAFILTFPTQPFSDFNRLLAFAESFRQTEFATGFRGWEYFGIGLPLGLSLVLRLVPGPPADVARLATAVLTAATSLLPFLLWRGALRLPARVTASLLLALWPGHVFFSGVVAQDNWVLLPSVGLAALSVRVMVTRQDGYPLVAALLFVGATATRQEMLVVLFPVALGAAGLLRPWGAWRWRPVGVWLASTALLLAGTAGLRWAGSGRFSLTTQHAGIAILGAATPGAANGYWTFPDPYVAAFAPHLVHNEVALRAEATALGVRELLRRPRFHLIRIFAAVANCMKRSDSACLFWSVGADQALPESRRAGGQGFAAWATGPLEWLAEGLFALFFSALALAFRWRVAPVLLIASSMFLKVTLHGIMTAQPRYFVMVTAFALVSLGTIVEELGRPKLSSAAAVSAAAGLASASLLFWAGERAEAYVLRHEEQLDYRFPLRSESGGASMRCEVREGVLTVLKPTLASMRPLHIDPEPGESARAECAIKTYASRSDLAIEVSDGYSPGGLPGRFVQAVRVDGNNVWSHDLAAQAGGGWTRVPLGPLTRGVTKSVVVSVTAVAPERGWSWGIAASTSFRLAGLGTDGS